VVGEPFSPIAEGIRSIKVAIDHCSSTGGGKIVGITSSIANEGKSSISASLATLTAQAGARTILVDCDLRNPSLSRMLAPEAKSGVLELLHSDADVENALLFDAKTGVRFLPATIQDHVANSSEVLSSAAIQTLLGRLRGIADYVIIDLPPVMPIVDVRAASNLVDSYVYVVEWGQTEVDVVQQALRSAKGVQERLIGVVLNKADIHWLERFEGYSSGYYHHTLARYGISS
jgi:succinoglycan biosynthesis transport protein ExoP